MQEIPYSHIIRVFHGEGKILSEAHRSNDSKSVELISKLVGTVFVFFD